MSDKTPGRIAFEQKMKAQFPDGPPRSRPLHRPKPEYAEAIAAMQAEREHEATEPAGED